MQRFAVVLFVLGAVCCGASPSPKNAVDDSHRVALQLVGSRYQREFNRMSALELHAVLRARARRGVIPSAQSVASAVTAPISMAASAASAVAGHVPVVGTQIQAGADAVKLAADAPAKLAKLASELAKANLGKVLDMIPALLRNIQTVGEELLPVIGFEYIYGFLNGVFLGSIDDLKTAVQDCPAGKVKLETALSASKGIFQVIVQSFTSLQLNPNSVVNAVQSIIAKIVEAMTAFVDVCISCPNIWASLGMLIISLVTSIATEEAEAATGVGTVAVAVEIVIGLIPSVDFIATHAIKFVEAMIKLGKAASNVVAGGSSGAVSTSESPAAISSQSPPAAQSGQPTAKSQKSVTGPGAAVTSALIANKNVIGDAVREIGNIMGAIVGSLNFIGRVEQVAGKTLASAATKATKSSGMLEKIMPSITKMTRGKATVADVQKSTGVLNKAVHTVDAAKNQPTKTTHIKDILGKAPDVISAVSGAVSSTPTPPTPAPTPQSPSPQPVSG